jgi:hypothetical protein
VRVGAQTIATTIAESCGGSCSVCDPPIGVGDHPCAVSITPQRSRHGLGATVGYVISGVRPPQQSRRPARRRAAAPMSSSPRGAAKLRRAKPGSHTTRAESSGGSAESSGPRAGIFGDFRRPRVLRGRCCASGNARAELRAGARANASTWRLFADLHAVRRLSACVVRTQEEGRGQAAYTSLIDASRWNWPRA